jgi:hypothetical protein
MVTVTTDGEAVAVPAPPVRSRVAVVVAPPRVIEAAGKPDPPAPGRMAMVPPLLVLVAVADVAVVETDPVEVPALIVAKPVVWATVRPNWVSRSPSEMPPTGGVGNVPKIPCRAVNTGVPAWMIWVSAPPAPAVN